MRVLHVLDHSIPLQSGSTFRTRAILREQRKLGWETIHLTTPKHVAPRYRDVFERLAAKTPPPPRRRRSVRVPDETQDAGACARADDALPR